MAMELQRLRGNVEKLRQQLEISVQQEELLRGDSIRLQTVCVCVFPGVISLPHHAAARSMAWRMLGNTRMMKLSWTVSTISNVARTSTRGTKVGEQALKGGKKWDRSGMSDNPTPSPPPPHRYQLPGILEPTAKQLGADRTYRLPYGTEPRSQI
ncbi:hypothetical protein AAFF_G00188400 [Aldrovandia affinis]|uniref:Uncharacterized protein n=1 Tax=Aldrovandia affinis TaxID=143900 RepID=A0AAD7SYW1_9TELE|nr:hypothetical protein AAFF_G00188400 [Aldrovandia affinis]